MTEPSEHVSSAPTRGAGARLGLLTVALVAAGWLLWMVVDAAIGELSLAAVAAWVDSAGLWAPAASVALMVVHTVVPFPAELLAAANGMVFGAATGALVTWLSGLAGAASGYAVGVLFERWLMRRAGYAAFLARARHLVERHGTAWLLVVRLLPVIPFNLIDYAAGALRLPWWQFGWTTALGILPWSALMSAGGTQVLPALRGDPVALGLIAGISALLVLTIWVGRRRYGRRAAAAAPPSAPPVAQRASGGPVTARFAVNGMTCELCARKVTAVLCAEAGVDRVQVVVEDGEVWVHFDPRRTTLHRLDGAIRGRGFVVDGVFSGSRLERGEPGNAGARHVPRVR